MEIMPNGNYESKVDYVQHECTSKNCSWSCIQYASDMSRLILKIYDGDPYEDGYENEVCVRYCPFCGFGPVDK